MRDIETLKSALRDAGIAEETLKRLESLDQETKAEALRQAAILLNVSVEDL